MLKFIIQNAAISWPNKCVFCGGQATTQATARCSIVTDVGYYILFVQTKHRILSLKYPVCSKHKIIASIAGSLSKRSILNLLVGVIWAFIVIPLAIMCVLYTYDNLLRGQYFQGLVTSLILFFIVGIGPLFYIIIFFLTPVKINSVTDNVISLSISNNDYANDFELLNTKIILKKLKWWQR